jgi:hypothetical protein
VPSQSIGSERATDASADARPPAEGLKEPSAAREMGRRLETTRTRDAIAA